MQIAEALRKVSGESGSGGWKIFAHHIVAECLNDRDPSVSLRGEIVVPLGMEKKFIQIHQTNPVGASTAFVPAGFEKGKVRVQVRLGVALERPDLDLRRRAEKFDRPIGGMIIVDNDAIDERLIMLKEEWDDPFFVPTGGVKMNGHGDGIERSK
jgi:hypothetical protein